MTWSSATSISVRRIDVSMHRGTGRNAPMLLAPAGLPGNDDQAAMATVLIWHLLGLYPGAVALRSNLAFVRSHKYLVPGTSEILVISPFLPTYTIHNRYLGVNTTVTVKGFDPTSVQQYIPAGAAAYVQNVTINGVSAPSRCHFDFYDAFRVGGEIVI